MPHMPLERGYTPAGQRVIGPSKFTELYPENAIFWDTICWGAAEPDVPSLFWLSTGQTVAGYTLPASWVDYSGNALSPADAGLLNPRAPELRYRGPQSDRFSQSTNPLKNPSGAITWYAYETLEPIAAEIADANQDTGWGPIWYFSFGSPRWRHNGNSMANVAFADGSVRSLRLNKGRKYTVGGDVHYDNEFRRRMLMTKWPRDKRDSGTIPTD
jgi:prepilin-type processing-associated H-X9-DG protein